MRFRAGMVAAFLGLLGVGLAAPAGAQAAPSTGVDEVVAALGLSSEPADYVVLVDTSGSMRVGDKYAKVRHELSKLVAGLDSDDRVSLATFDTKVTPRYRGVVGGKPAAVTAALPADAKGKHTDIGAAIAAGLTELERQDTRRLAALILITDGKLDAPGSKYADTGSSAWKQLRTRAAQLGEKHEVAAYAVSLQASTDAGLLKKVFPRATDVAAAQVGDRFAQVGNDLVLLQAAGALKKELAAPIEVHWSGDLGAALSDGRPVDAKVEFVSLYPHVPVQLSDLRVQAPAGLDVQLQGLPDHVDLKPNERVTIPVRAALTGTVGSGAKLSLAATVSSPWQKALQDGLGLQFAPELQGAATVPPPPIKLPPSLLPTVGAITAAVLGLLLVVHLALMLLAPSMTGLLTFRRDGRELADVVLRGHRMKVTTPPGATDLTGLAGTAKGARPVTRGQRAVRVDVRFGTTSAKGVIPDGGVIRMGDVEIAYTSGRRRILDKIGIPREDPAAN